MITAPVVLDAGPLVALLNRRDLHHERCRSQASQLAGPVITTWAVATEAAWLLRRVPGGLQRLFDALESPHVDCIHLEVAAVGWMKQQAAQYDDLQPQLADLSLLYLADVYRTSHVFTLDRREFLVYRTSRGQPFELLPAEAG